MPLAAYLGRKLSDGEVARIQQSFEDALRRTQLSAEELFAQDRGGASRVLREARRFRPPPLRRNKRRKRGEERKEKKEADAAFERVATRLTEGWRGAAETSAKHSPSETSSWQVALRQYLEAAARDGMEGDSEGSQWRLVVAGDRSRRPEPEEIERWAGRVASETVKSWRRDPMLRELVSQLNYESGFEVAEALVLSSRDIARSIRWAVFLAIPALLLGGGGVALLVVLIAGG